LTHGDPFKIVALTPKYPEVLDIGLVAGEDLIWGLVQALAEIQPVCRMISGINGFIPKVIQRLKLC
jgi:hypothetical protein